MIVNTKLLQELMAYAAIVFAVLTQAFPSIGLPPVASGVLGAFGIVLHPLTSVNATVSASSTAVQPQQQQQATKIGGV